jgi:hypothetical protein
LCSSSFGHGAFYRARSCLMLNAETSEKLISKNQSGRAAWL